MYWLSLFAGLRNEELEVFSVSLSKRLIHFSIRDFIGNQLMNRKIIALLRNLSTLRKLKVTKRGSFANILSWIPKTLISLDLNHFGFALNFFDEEHDQEIDWIVSLINNNEQMIISLHIRDDRIEDHILNDICGERDFNELTLNCLLISLQNLVQMLES
jgi:hypothetical protein